MLGIYCRTSKNKEKGKDYSIETQKQGGIKLANYLGIDYKPYIDEGKSGTLDIEDRIGFAEMMTDIKRKKITGVYCIDQSRIERNTDIWRFFVGECINHKCKYYPNGNELDLNDPDSMLFANLLSLVNSYYAAITSKKVKYANYLKAKKGKTHGLKAYGYKRDEKNEYVIFEDEAKIVRRIFNYSLDGVGSYTIANILNAEGVPTKFNQFDGRIIRKDEYTKRETYFEKSKVKWRGNVIHDILRNPIYKGVRIWNKDDIDKRIEVQLKTFIIKPALWDKVNANLPSNKKNVGKRAEYHYLLNGLVFCSHCGNEIIGKKRLKGNDNAYKCKGKRPPHNDCKESRGLSLPKLETFIIKHLFESRDLKKLLVNAPKNGTEALLLRNKREQKEKAKIHLTKSIEKILSYLRDPDLEDDPNLIRDYKATNTKLKVAEEEIEKLTIRIAEAENNLRNKRTKSLIESYTGDAGFEEVKRLVHSLVERIELYHGKEKKSGHFILKIVYRHYRDESIFITNWQAMKWIWSSYHRKEALTEADLNEDIDLIKGLSKFYKKKVSIPKDFKGLEQSAIKHESIQLKEEELIYFD